MNKRRMITFLILTCMIVMGSFCMAVSAEGLEEDLGNTESTVESPGYPTDNSGSSTSDDDTGVADLFKNHEPVTSDQMSKAKGTLSPITNFFGYIIGGALVLVCAGIFLITALDLLYLAVPPLRGLLYKGAQDEMQGGYGSGGYGMGGGYGMRGGYGGGGAQRGLRFQLISDEAVQCSMLIGGGQQGASGGMPGGYQNTYSPQNEMSNKSVIGVYLKKRIFFMILLAVCSVILMSSVFLDTGINLAKWAMNMITLLNDAIPV